MLYTQRQKLSDLVTKFLKFQSNIKSTNSNTYKSYAIDLKQFRAHIFEYCPTKKEGFQDVNLRALHHALSCWSPLKASSRNRKHACVKSFLKWLHAEGHLERPLDHHVICPKVPKKVPHFLSIDEVLSLLKYLESEVENNKGGANGHEAHRNYCLILLLYGGALRVSEACQLKWVDHQPNKSQLLIHGKGQKERIIAIPDYIDKKIMRLEKVGPYILSATESPLNPRSAYGIVRSAGQACGLLKPLHPHALRHSLATHLLSGGMNLRILQTLLGHESLTATEKYTHLGIDKLEEVLKKSHPLG